MPITFPATSRVNLVSKSSGENAVSSLRDAIEASSTYVAAYTDSSQHEKYYMSGEKMTMKPSTIVQSSKGPDNIAYANKFGLVSAVLHAYNYHQCLSLDPNDVWVTILAQFSAYVNGGRAESLRDRIVDFKGKKTLVVYSDGTLFSTDFGDMAVRMVDEIGENIKDSSLRDWFLPQFSTSTTTDICCAASCMSALQSYFEYWFRCGCGIPKVTLTGTVDDWVQLRTKVERLTEFDLEDKLMTKWLTFLRPVCDNLVSSASGKADLHFWDTICSHKPNGSGTSYLSGWITAFSVFSNEGTWQGECKNGSKWPFIDCNNLAYNVVSVPVTIIDENTVPKKEYNAMLFAGQFIREMNKETILPRNDWCIALEA